MDKVVYRRSRCDYTAAAMISLCIMTHARHGLLQEALWSALKLNPGPDEIIVFNDCRQQELFTKHPKVQVINAPSTFPTLGQKRNALMRIAAGDWLAWLDDDDIVLPHHLSVLEYRIAADAPNTVWVNAKLGFWFNGVKGELKACGTMGALIRRQESIETGFGDSAHEEMVFQSAMSRRYPRFIADAPPSYVERWGNGAYHVSGQGLCPEAFNRFQQDAIDRIARGEEPSGPLEVAPTAPVFDFVSACADIYQQEAKANAS